MKPLPLFSSLLACAALMGGHFVFAAAPTPTPVPAAPAVPTGSALLKSLAGGPWTLSGWTAADGTAGKGGGITLTFTTDGGVSGHAPVNNYFGGVKMDDKGALTWTPFGSTMMAGPDADMEREMHYFADVAKTAKAALVDGKLMLTGEGKLRLEFTRAAAPGVASLLKSIAGAQWTLTNWIGTDGTVIAATGITLTIGTDGKVSGRGPVNNYFGSVKLDDKGAVTWSPFGSTRMAGPPERMQLETQYFAYLEKTKHAALMGDKLVFSVEGTKMKLEFTKGAVAKAGN